MTHDEQFEELTQRLDGILKLLALQAISGKKIGEAAVELERAGLDRKIIAEVLGTSQSSVRKFVSRKKGRKSTSKNKEDSGEVAENQ